MSGGWWLVSKYAPELHAWGIGGGHYKAGAKPFRTRAEAVMFRDILRATNPSYDGPHRVKVVRPDHWLKSQLISKVLNG